MAINSLKQGGDIDDETPFELKRSIPRGTYILRWRWTAPKPDPVIPVNVFVIESADQCI